MDKVVAVTQYKHSVIVVTQYGKVYQITIGDFGHETMVKLILELNLRQ